MDQRVFIFLLVIWAKVEASNTTAKSSWTVLLKVFENCMDNNDSLNCLQQKVLNFANRMTQSKSLEVFEGFKFVRDEGIGRSMSDSESTDLGASLGDQIFNKISTFFRTHSVEVNIPKFLDTDNEARKKKGGGNGILMLAGAAKGAMIYMGMHVIAALAGKALIVAKVALTIASVIALKKLLEGSGGKTSYEIVKHPQHTYVQTHSSSHEYGGGGHGGGGHGGGYEGHYRKRSIAKTKMNVNQESALPTEFGGASDFLRFELPENETGVRFSNSLNDANESQRPDNGNSNEEREFFFNKQTADQNQRKISKHNLFAVDIESKNRPVEFDGKALNNDNEFSPLQLRRSRLTKLV